MATNARARSNSREQMQPISSSNIEIQLVGQELPPPRVIQNVQKALDVIDEIIKQGAVRDENEPPTKLAELEFTYKLLTSWKNVRLAAKNHHIILLRKGSYLEVQRLKACKEDQLREEIRLEYERLGIAKQEPESPPLSAVRDSAAVNAEGLDSDDPVELERLSSLSPVSSSHPGIHESQEQELQESEPAASAEPDVGDDIIFNKAIVAGLTPELRLKVRDGGKLIRTIDIKAWDAKPVAYNTPCALCRSKKVPCQYQTAPPPESRHLPLRAACRSCAVVRRGCSKSDASAARGKAAKKIRETQSAPVKTEKNASGSSALAAKDRKTAAMTTPAGTKRKRVNDESPRSSKRLRESDGASSSKSKAKSGSRKTPSAKAGTKAKATVLGRPKKASNTNTTRRTRDAQFPTPSSTASTPPPSSPTQKRRKAAVSTKPSHTTISSASRARGRQATPTDTDDEDTPATSREVAELRRAVVGLREELGILRHQLSVGFTLKLAAPP